jgi:1-deoxy-D-xylulose-5-phosphate reductoisomerase
VLAAIAAGKSIALANKEVLVMAGALVTKAARARGVPLLPVDSEHNAIHQCLHGRQPGEVTRLILTASGGPSARGRPRSWSTPRPKTRCGIRHGRWAARSRSTRPR